MGRPPRITRDQILAAARAAFAERGFGSTTLADIAEVLGVTPAAILRYFDSKQELFTASMSARDLRLPQALEDLAHVDPATDPRIVLRKLASQAVPFLQSVIGSAIAVQMHMRARQTTLVLPFDPAAEAAPPRRVLRAVADYFRRAMQAGVLREADPQALALLFVGHVQSYVFLHTVLDVTPVYPLDRYLDALIDLWLNGAITGVADGQEDRDRPGRPRGRNRGPALPAKGKAAEAARPQRTRRGADGGSGVARRRPRGSRPRR